MIYFSGSNQMGGNRKYCGRERGDSEAQLGEKMEGKEWIKFIFMFIFPIPPRVTRLPKTKELVFPLKHLMLFKDRISWYILHRAHGWGEFISISKWENFFYREKCRSFRWPLSTDKDFVVFIKIFVTNGGYYPRYTSAPFIAFSFVLLYPADLKSMPDKFKRYNSL